MKLKIKVTAVPEGSKFRYQIDWTGSESIFSTMLFHSADLAASNGLAVASQILTYKRVANCSLDQAIDIFKQGFEQ